MKSFRPARAATALCAASIQSTMHRSKRVFSTFDMDKVFSSKEKLLLTPGPLSTSPTVKACLTRDFGSRDQTFINLIQSVRDELLNVAQVSNKEYTSILMQGSGTFAVEAAIGTVIPRGDKGKLLVITNGAYADRAGKIAKVLQINHEFLRYVEDTKPNADDVEKMLAEHASKGAPFSTVFMVHSETTSGLVNPIEAVGKMAKKYSCDYMVDGMSSFGGIPIDFEQSGIDVLVTSANKCLQGVPGFGVVICKRSLLEQCEERARSLSLDLFDQEKGLRANGQFRFTPPTHTICAFQKALDELKEEGGVAQRYKRYVRNKEIVVEAMEKLGFELYLEKSEQGRSILRGKQRL